MDENTKRHFDAVAELWKRCWQNIVERRGYEWRVAFTLWTAFAALIALILKRQLPPRGYPVCPGVIIIAGIGLLLCIIHGVWLAALGKRTVIDREMAIHYEEILRRLSDSAFPAALEARIEKMRQKQKTSFDWSRQAQLAVTLVLFFAAILTVLAIVG